MAGLDINLRSIEGEKGAAIAEMAGAIDGTTVVNFQESLEEIKKKGIKKLILDMSKIKYVNSTGLGSLVKYADTFKTSGGGMALIKVPAKVKIVIEMLGLHAFFEICKDQKDALEALAKAPAAPAPAPAAAPAAPAARAAAPPKAAAPSLAPVVTAAGPISFPYMLSCSNCGILIEFKNFGNYMCPRCHTLVALKKDGTAKFMVSDKPSPIQLSLPCHPECAEGLKLFVGALSKPLLDASDKIDALKNAIGEVCNVLTSIVYENKKQEVYHVNIDRTASELKIKIADHGKTLDSAKIETIFPNAAKFMNEFQCRAHPNGGNIIHMVKRKA